MKKVDPQCMPFSAMQCVKSYETVNSRLITIQFEPRWSPIVTMRAPTHVFALHETYVVAISSTACYATAVAHVIFKLHPFVLAPGFSAVQIAWKKCVCFWCRVSNKTVIE